MKQYKKLSRVATKYHNDNNFCAVVAIAVATNKKFCKIRSMLAKEGRKHRKGTPQPYTEKVLNKLGYELVRYDSYSWPKTLTTATRMLPSKGTFLLRTRSHITCIKDGVMEDWAATGSRKRVYQIQQVKEI